MRRDKDLEELKEALSKDGPRVRIGGCVAHGHKPKYVRYGFPPTEIKKPIRRKV